MAEEEVRNSADMAGADFKVKMEKMRLINQRLLRKKPQTNLFQPPKRREKKLLPTLLLPRTDRLPYKSKTTLKKSTVAPGQTKLLRMVLQTLKWKKVM
jgi:hypothetical protein